MKEAKDDLQACLEEAKADYEESGKTAEPVEFRYQYDLQSFFDYFSFLNVSEIAKRAGVNPSLMRQYTRGIKTAGEKTYERLTACMANITKELQAASFRYGDRLYFIKQEHRKEKVLMREHRDFSYSNQTAVSVRPGNLTIASG